MTVHPFRAGGIIGHPRVNPGMRAELTTAGW